MSRKSKAANAIIGILMATLVAMPAVQAQSRRNPAELVDQRQAQMKALGASMKTLNAYAKGGADTAGAKKAAAVIAAAGRSMPTWWPKGTAHGVGDSEAAPLIWTDQQRFRQRLTGFQQASAAMNRAAATGDATKVGAELRTLGASCKACHDDFRLED